MADIASGAHMGAHLDLSRSKLLVWITSTGNTRTYTDHGV